MSDNLKVASFNVSLLEDLKAGKNCTREAATAIEQLEAQLASQQAAHEAEIARLKEAQIKGDSMYRALEDKLDAANAACAMKDELLTRVYNGMACWTLREVKEAISATQQQVSEWEAKKLEPLRAQVAMLVRFIEDHESADNSGGEYPSECIACGERYGKHIKDCELVAVTENTQAAAEAFIAECEQRGAVKVLEDILKLEHTGMIAPHEVRRRIAQLSATSKKAG